MMLAKHIPDFYILKYVMYDLWTDDSSIDVTHRSGPSPEMAMACQEAVAEGAACNVPRRTRGVIGVLMQIYAYSICIVYIHIYAYINILI